jgi:hypothetical protein
MQQRSHASINIADGRHSYDLEHTLPDAPMTTVGSANDRQPAQRITSAKNKEIQRQTNMVLPNPVNTLKTTFSS